MNYRLEFDIVFMVLIFHRLVMSEMVRYINCFVKDISNYSFKV